MPCWEVVCSMYLPIFPSSLYCKEYRLNPMQSSCRWSVIMLWSRRCGQGVGTHEPRIPIMEYGVPGPTSIVHRPSSMTRRDSPPIRSMSPLIFVPRFLFTPALFSPAS